jgi:hypothetical protein
LTSNETKPQNLPELAIVKSEDVPREIWDAARREAQRYSVGILAIIEIKNGEKLQLVGTGTLIKYKTTIGILTAKHVVQGKLFQQCTSMGLVFEKTRRFTISKSEFRVKYIDNLDVALIIIYSINTESISAIQSFINIDEYYSKRNEIDFVENKWFVLLFGFPEEKQQTIVPFLGFTASLRFLGLSYFSIICGTESLNKHDVLLVIIDFSNQHGIVASENYSVEEILPRDFGGVSGGGLWKVILTIDQNGEMKYTKLLFEGVAFFQTGIADNRCQIKCTSVRSIWSDIIKILQEYSH